MSDELAQTLIALLLALFHAAIAYVNRRRQQLEDKRHVDQSLDRVGGGGPADSGGTGADPLRVSEAEAPGADVAAESRSGSGEAE